MPTSFLRTNVALVTVVAAMALGGCGSDGEEPSWSDAASFEGAGDDVYSYDLAMSSQGEAMVVWGQSGGGEWKTRDYSVWAARFTPSSGWSAPARLSAPPGNRSAFSPSVAINANGQAVAAWQEHVRYPHEPDDEGIWVARFDPETGWDERVFVGPDGHSVDVALNDAGRAVMVWGDFSWTVRASQSDLGPRWSEPTRLDRDCVAPLSDDPFLDGNFEDDEGDRVGGDANVPNVAISESGDAIVVWDGAQHEGDTLGPCGEVGLFVRRFSSGAGWSAPTKLKPRVPIYRYGRLHAALALDREGRALAGSLVGAVSAYREGEGWTDLDLGYELGRASVAAASSGHAIVVSEVNGGWESQSDSHLESMRVARFTLEAGWTVPETIHAVPATRVDDSPTTKSPTILDSAVVDVVINDAGQAIVAWYQTGSYTEGYRFTAWTARYDPGRGWTAPSSLAVGGDFDAIAPRVVIDGQGRGIAVWQGRRVGEDDFGEGLLMWSRFE